MSWHNIAWFLVALCALRPQVLRLCEMRVFMGCARNILLALITFFFAAPVSFAQVSPPAAPPRLVYIGLTQVSGHSVVYCTVKNSSGLRVPSQTVSVQKSSTIQGSYAVWMSKKTNVKGQAIFPMRSQRTPGTCDAPPRASCQRPR